MTQLQRDIIAQLRRALTELEARTSGDALIKMCVQLLAILEDSFEV